MIWRSLVHCLILKLCFRSTLWKGRSGSRSKGNFFYCKLGLVVVSSNLLHKQSCRHFTLWTICACMTLQLFSLVPQACICARQYCCIFLQATRKSDYCEGLYGSRKWIATTGKGCCSLQLWCLIIHTFLSIACRMRCIRLRVPYRCECSLLLHYPDAHVWQAGHNLYWNFLLCDGCL